MITIHTFENDYDDGSAYHQFAQWDGQPLLESLGIGQSVEGESLRQFLMHSIIGDCLAEPDLTDRNLDRFARLLVTVLDTGDLTKLLSFAGRVCEYGRPGADPRRTRFGVWGYASVALSPPQDFFAPFKDLASALGKHQRGFTVILGYPDGFESYSGASEATTWEDAVKDVAARMLQEGHVGSDDELFVVDVMEGPDHPTAPGVDRYAKVVFDAAGSVNIKREGDREQI